MTGHVARLLGPSILLTVILASGLAACGAGGPGPAEVLASSMDRSRALADLRLSTDESSCAADAAGADIGDDRMAALVPDDDDADMDLSALTDDELAAVVSALGDCVPDLDRRLSAALKAGILDKPDENLPVDDDEATCVADGLVDGVGAERLLVVGIASGEGDPFADGALESAEADVVADSFLDCLDIRQVFEDQFVAEGVPAEAAACLAREIPEDNLRDLFARQFAGDPVEADQLLGPALATCGLG